MNKKKKGSIIIKILGGLFVIYIALFIANMSGYYESKIRDQVVVTDKGIKEFEEKVKNGEEIDITSFLKNDREDYSNNVSNLGEKVTSGVENIVVDGIEILGDIIKSLF